MVDRKESGRIIAHEVLNLAIFAGIAVGRVHLLDPLADHRTLLDACCVVGQVKHWWVVVTVADFHTERAESCKRLAALVLGLDCHAVISDTYLCLPVKHVRRPDDAGDRVNVKPVAALVVGLDQRVGHIAIGTGVEVDSLHLEVTTISQTQ